MYEENTREDETDSNASRFFWRTDLRSSIRYLGNIENISNPARTLDLSLYGQASYVSASLILAYTY